MNDFSIRADLRIADGRLVYPDHTVAGSIAVKDGRSSA